jgi:hypothetical protein
MRIISTVVIAASLLATWSSGVAGQETPAPSKSTLNGVYTDAQATRGEETFAGMCMSCHPPSEHTGQTFLSKWTGKPLLELYLNIKDLMPKSDPGSLSPGEYAQVTAYILKQNGMPAGSEELTSDTAALRLIQFDSLPAKLNFHPDGVRQTKGMAHVATADARTQAGHHRSLDRCADRNLSDGNERRSGARPGAGERARRVALLGC